MSLSRGRGVFWALAVLAVLAAVSAWNLAEYLGRAGQATRATAPVPVTLEPARLEEVAVVLEQSAEVEPAQKALIIPKVKGQAILEMPVDRGDRVAAGQLLARLDDATVRARLAEVRAQLAQARAADAAALARLDTLTKDLERYRRLAKSGSAAAQKLEHAESEHAAALAQRDLARAQIEAARAGEKLLNIVLDDHTIEAPFAGQIAKRFMDPGALSSDKDPMFLLVRTDQVKVTTTVGERELPLAALGQPVEMTLDGYPGRTFRGRITGLSPSLDPATRSGVLEVEIPNPDGALKPGMFARLRLVLGARQALTVPRTAVQRLPGTGASYLFTVAEGKARQLNVDTGPAQGLRREITGGLEAGQEVVVKGATRVTDGTPVTTVGGEAR